MSAEENATFDKAVAAAGVKGERYDYNKQRYVKAVVDFSDYYHEEWDKDERETHGYHGIVNIARDWWEDQKHKYKWDGSDN